jgi:[ribosomal protein S18]-alanine N-acetyltransferase
MTDWHLGEQPTNSQQTAADPLTKPHLTLQPLTPELLPAVVELDRRCFDQLWTLAGYQRELDSPNSELLVLSSTPPSPSPAPLSPKILGLGCYWAILEEAHITIVAIDPDYHHQGLGQFMLCQLLHSAYLRGLERATLEVRASHTSAIALYTKFAFQVAGRRKNYYPDNQEDALILWLGGLQKPDFLKLLAVWQQQTRDRLAAQGWLIEIAIYGDPLT